MPLADQLPTAIRDAGQEQAATIREAGGGLIFDGLPFLVVLLGFGPIGLPLVKDRDRDTGQGVGQAAPPPSLKVPVAAIKVDQPIRKEPCLALKVAAGGSGFGLDLVPLKPDQLLPLKLPVALRARPEGGNVEGGHVRGNP
jgi:hypothetical protein